MKIQTIIRKSLLYLLMVIPMTAITAVYHIIFVVQWMNEKENKKYKAHLRDIWVLKDSDFWEEVIGI